MQAGLIRRLVVLREAWARVRRRAKRRLFYERVHAQPELAIRPTPQPPPPPRVLAAIVHITSIEEHRNPQTGRVKVERLQVTLDGLLASLAHCRLTILVITMKERHVVPFLPGYLRAAVEVVEVEGGDPMFIGYPAQDALIGRRDGHDWFMFLEDDIEIRDSAFLDKVARFCSTPGMERCVLLPNRYEYWRGVKSYIDLTHMKHMISWNRQTLHTQDDNRLAECTNPHAGMFCLSRQQVDVLVASGRDFRGMNLYGGSRESAATFSLQECFTLYHPCPENFGYLEVRHVDTKYSQMHPDMVDYVFCAIDRPPPERAEARP